jgi:hypothetical protein
MWNGEQETTADKIDAFFLALPKAEWRLDQGPVDWARQGQKRIQ